MSLVLQSAHKNCVITNSSKYLIGNKVENNIHYKIVFIENKVFGNIFGYEQIPKYLTAMIDNSSDVIRLLFVAYSPERKYVYFRELNSLIKSYDFIKGIKQYNLNEQYIKDCIDRSIQYDKKYYIECIDKLTIRSRERDSGAKLAQKLLSDDFKSKISFSKDGSYKNISIVFDDKSNIHGYFMNGEMLIYPTDISFFLDTTYDLVQTIFVDVERIYRNL